MPDSLSVIKLRDVLLVTVPPDPDDATVTALQERILEAMARHESKGLVLDISTVQTLDSFFARTINDTVQMVTLMGGRTVVAGMRPSVAVTATQLGITLRNAETALDVDQALYLLRGSRAAPVQETFGPAKRRQPGPRLAAIPQHPSPSLSQASSSQSDSLGPP